MDKKKNAKNSNLSKNLLNSESKMLKKGLKRSKYLRNNKERITLTEDAPDSVQLKDGLCPSGYPPEELMDRFSEIVKGRTYLHRPNQALNLYLTGTLVIVAAMVFGLGFGHFKG